mgnify:FL=1
MKLFNNFTLVLCFAFAAQAHAAINPGSDYDQGGELILSVWDNSTSTSYTLDLGIDTREFDSERTYVYDLSADENWIQFFANADSTQWDVAGSHLNSTPYPGVSAYEFMTTARIGEDTSVFAVQLSTYENLRSALDIYTNYLNGVHGPENGFAYDFSYFLSGTNYVGSTDTWGSFAGIINFATAGYGESMDFWHLTTTIDSPECSHRCSTPNHTKLAGTWTLSDNQLIYTTAAPVPVPAAVWLFGSALAGLVGISRRRRK